MTLVDGFFGCETSTEKDLNRSTQFLIVADEALPV